MDHKYKRKGKKEGLTALINDEEAGWLLLLRQEAETMEILLLAPEQTKPAKWHEKWCQSLSLQPLPITVATLNLNSAINLQIYSRLSQPYVNLDYHRQL